MRIEVLDTVHPTALPAESLLRRYQVDGTYADCFMARVSGKIEHSNFVSAFYTTWLFKIERLILKIAASLPASDEQAIELGLGTRDQFAAWHVEARSRDQLLLCDFTGRTRSWLMTAAATNGTPSTCLYFGSAVVPRINPATGVASMGTTYKFLLGFHKLYSRMLLRAACAKLPD